MRAREVVGYVRRGEDPVAGAIVRVAPSDGFAASGATVASTLTDAGGFFGGLRPVALRYDLAAKLGDDLLFYTGLGGRYIEPALEGPRTTARAFTGRVDIHLDRAVPEGHSVAFFANGDGVLGVTGDLASGLSVRQQRYTTEASIHVIEYETAGGFEKATAYGKIDIALDAGVVRLATVTLQPIPYFVEPQFAVTAPSAFAPANVDVYFGFSRTSDGLLAAVPVGTSKKLPIIPNAGYTYRARSTVDGVVSDTGEISFDVLLPLTAIELPEPPTAMSPIEGETRAAGESLLVEGEGVFEHVLVPEDGGREIRIITRQHEVALPDVGVLGAAPATGPHTWTVRSYTTASVPEQLSGIDSRRYRAMSVSRPRSIILR